ncbi:biotin transporter BioY [Candidatus Puniceispirillum sp.]|nr:biotin transporter BioY [Candidatus Puniceispirillum sp.]
MLEAHNSHAVKVRFPVLTEALIAGPLLSKSIRTPALKAFLVVIGSLLLATSAQFKIPLYPVPVTGQTLVVLLIGMVYGPWLGGVTIAAYLLQGVIGLPVFAGGAFGIATLLGPTGGYLGGFLIAAIVMGVLAERGMGRGIMSTIIAMMIGNVVIYVAGASWLASFVGAEKALTAGVLPFLYGDVLKLAVAAGLMPVAWRLIKKLQK